MRPRQVSELEPIGYSPETVLTLPEVARWLRISERQAERMNIPCFYLGDRTRRYLVKTLVEFCEKREVA